MGETFFVCFYKDKQGQRIGHAISSKNDFPEKIGPVIEVDQKAVSKSKFESIFLDFCHSMNGYMDMLPMVAIIGSVITRTIRESELSKFCKDNTVDHISVEDREIYEVPLVKVGDFQSIDRRARSGHLVSK